MKLSVAQTAQLSQLLDDVLPLDAAGRRAWLEQHSAEYPDLAEALRKVLLPDDAQTAGFDRLAALPKIGAAEAPAAAGGNLHAGLRVGPYELIRPLGAGGMAQVWLARRADGAFRREVALKLPTLTHLRGDLEQRFAQERDILASLEHPHIARFYDAGVDPNGWPYLALEYVHGDALTDYCTAHRLDIAARLGLFLQVLDAVQFAHSKHVIHRDLKPSNILVNESGEVQLLDFGIAKLLEGEEADQTPLTGVYGRALTPDYASPELLRGAPVDARSDVYSLGVLLYELLTGVRPYALRSAASVGLLEHAVAVVDVQKPSARLATDTTAAGGTPSERLVRQLRGDLDAITLKALARDPARRYSSAAALAEDLRRYLRTQPIDALPASTIDRSWKFLQRNRTLVAAAVTAVTAIAVVAGFLLLRSPGEAPGKLWLDPLAQARSLRLTDFAGKEQAAAVSRDGKYAAFLAARGGPLDIWVTEIGTNRYRNVTEGKIQQLRNPEIRTLGFSPDGSLVTFWTRAGDGSRAQDIGVMAAPTAGGALQPYLPEIAESDWSPDGRELVFHTTAPGDPLFVRAAADAVARQIYVAAPGMHCHFPTWSSDGKFIYFVRGDPPSADWDIWRLRPSGTGLERLTFHHTQVTYPVPLDAQTLLYLATDVDGSGPWLYVTDVRLKRTRRVSVGLERYTSLAASADRTRLVATVADVRSALWRVAVGSDGPPATLAEPLASVTPNSSSPRFGPGYIAYVSNDGARRGIWKYADGAAKELWGDGSVDRVGAPSIAPDGRRIAFTVERRGATQLYTVDQDGQNPKAVSQTLALRGDLAWAPDSRSLLGAVAVDGEPRLARIFLDSTAPQWIVSDYSVDPVWSPDGKYFVYSGAQVATIFPLRASAPDGRPYDMPGLILTTGARRVAFARNSASLVFLRGGIDRKDFWQRHPQSGTERQLTALPAGFAIGDFDVSPDGAEILFDRIQESSSVMLIERGKEFGAR
jgi:serine/threonine protein kinase/Tol biopolymer transport system component